MKTPKIQVSQEEWDAKLLQCFYHHKDVPMWRLTECVDLDDMKPLLRVPRQAHLSMTVTAFISRYIPKLGKILWELDESKTSNVLAALKSSRLDTLKGQYLNKEKMNLRRKESQDNTRISIMSNKRREYNAKSNGRDWGVCR
ncbi:MAG: hypothetical protein OEY89_11315 [Gammaproteobacteria bacterium]|nr:hypothetical protein [Gammaproteobacteria bacterium]